MLIFEAMRSLEFHSCNLYNHNETNVDKAFAKKENMAEINIIIDEITHCLIERVSGTECPTALGRIHPNERQFTDWKLTALKVQIGALRSA
jgi:hypothetical protein